MKTDDSHIYVRSAAIMTTADLLAAGRSQEQIRTLVKRGELLRLGIGIYATSELAESVSRLPFGELLLSAAAAVRALGPAAVVSHRTAAQIHGLDLLGRPSSLVSVTRPPGVGSRSGRPGVLLHSAELPAEHIGARMAVPVTTVGRTVVDLARMSPFREGVVVADSALNQKLTSKKELGGVLTGCRRWRGVRKAAEVVEFADGLSESPLESIARVVFRDCGLPPPELQVEIGADEFIGRVDFLWE